MKERSTKQTQRCGEALKTQHIAALLVPAEKLASLKSDEVAEVKVHAADHRVCPFLASMVNWLYFVTSLLSHVYDIKKQV